MADETLKTCACCKQVKPRSDFPKKAANKDGLYSYCKPCNVEKVRQYHARRPDWAEYKKAYDRERTQRLKEKLREQNKRRYEKNRERCLETARDWVKRNPEKRKAIAQNYKHRRRAQEREGMTGAELAKWQKEQPRKCYWCGTTKAKAYAVDHYVPLAKGGKHEASNLVLACKPCNSRKSAKDPLDFAREIGRLM